MDKIKIGFTAGVFDMFHVGHLNLIKNARSMCDFLIVGVNSDELVMKYKNKKTVISDENRREIVEAIKYVDQAVIVDTLDKMDCWGKYNFDIVFIGDDWKGSERWNETERELQKYGINVEYIPYTKKVSSTKLRAVEKLRIKE